MLQTELLAELMKEVGPRLAYLNLYFQGEPYLHKGMDDLVKLGRKQGVYTSTSTNAHFLRPERCEAIVESGLNRLIISIDGTTQDTYSSYRVGGQLDKVLEGTENMLRARKKSKSGLPHIVWQFLVVGPNEHQLSEIQSMAKQIGVDELVIKTAQIDAPKDGHPLLTEASSLRRYDRNAEGKWSIRNAFHDECWRMWQGCVMTWDGRIVPCCFDKDAEHAMGTFGDQSFESIWFSEQYDAFRSQIFHARSSIEMCQNCSEGTHVYA
jgi:radical SAM protein with 4Fe4S-binding SPASM domain